MKLAPLAIVIAACGSTPPPPAPLRTAEDAPALDALRGAKFAQAVKLADEQLALAPRDAAAAAIRALASYVEEADTIYVALDVRHSWFFIDKALEADRRPTLEAFIAKLDAIDKDLEVVAADPRFSLELCLACWQSDWNHDGAIDERDLALFQIENDTAGAALPADDPRRRPTFRFDVGDAMWGRAMLAFQRAAAELLLAYRWSDGKVDSGKEAIVIHLIAPERVKRARALVLAGLDLSAASRTAYLAETDDDREWVPSPSQHSHPVPLDVDAKLYATWAGVVDDVRDLVAGKRGISMHETAALIDPELAALAPDAYVDLGRMLAEPMDIRIAVDEKAKDAASFGRILRGLLGHGYAEQMRPSPLVQRLATMRAELERGSDSLGHKLRYLIWIN
ncbi:MAG: hypothetical protein ABI678_06545 [Kofleriaceae bacterium]